MASPFVGVEGYDMSSTLKHVRRLGAGAFGEVLLARHVVTGREYAVKRLFVRDPEARELPINVYRELQALRVLDHPNIVRLHTFYPDGSAVALVMERCSIDLATVVGQAAAGEGLPEPIAKALMIQLLRGLAYMHEAGVVHRDVKPGNMLLRDAPSPCDAQLKLADFGYARPLHSLSPPHSSSARPTYTPQVATRWYRAPELLFGAADYSTPVDVWGAGCCLGELLAPPHAPLFQGISDIGQIAAVMAILGTPRPEEWPQLATLPDYGKLSLRDVPPRAWEEALPSAPADGLDLLARLLVYDPDARLTAAEALQHPWLAQDSNPPPASSEAVAAFVAAAVARRAAAGGGCSKPPHMAPSGPPSWEGGAHGGHDDDGEVLLADLSGLGDAHVEADGSVRFVFSE